MELIPKKTQKFAGLFLILYLLNHIMTYSELLNEPTRYSQLE